MLSLKSAVLFLDMRSTRWDRARNQSKVLGRIRKLVAMRTISRDRVDDPRLRWTALGAPTHTANAGLGDVLTRLNGIPFMVNLEARNGRFGIMSDLMVVSLRVPASTGPYFSRATAQTTQFLTTEMGMYRVLEQRKQWLDLGVGFRTGSVWSKLTFNSGLAPGFTTSSAVSWAAPLFGIRYHYNITPRVGLTGYADVGGSGGGNMTWEVLGMLNYRYNSWLMLHPGYRHMHIDYTGSAL